MKRFTLTATLIVGLFFSFYCAKAQDCFDLGSVDFGDCEMAMGLGLVNNECVFISGCGWEVGGVDYSGYSFETMQECEACIVDDPCQDLAGIDFGLCDMVLGIGNVNGQCTWVSGCGWEVGGVDYSPYFFQNMSSCESCLSGDGCFDLSGIDFGPCDAILGVGVIGESCTYISGCGWEVGGIDYSQYSYESMAECQLSCEEDVECLDLFGVDFGLCDMPLGIANIDGTCVALSGCDWEVGGVDYSPYFFQSEEDCQIACTGCIDPELIGTLECPADFEPVCGCDNKTYWNSCYAQNTAGVTSWTAGPCACPDVNIIDTETACLTIYDPVCGCDGETYGNSCEAFFWAGITQWTEGPCDTGLEDRDEENISLYLSAPQLLQVRGVSHPALLRLYNLSGQIVYETNITPEQRSIQLPALSRGIYIAEAMEEGLKPVRKRIVKY